MKSQHTVARVETCSSNFTTITETPVQRATADQLQILFTRYHFAAECARGCDVLEAGCGAGVGLGYLASVARSVVAGDIDPENCHTAKGTYCGRAGITVERFDAQNMRFPNASFDVVVFLEAVYYIPDVDQFLHEARRVLRPGGVLLVSSVNCEWEGFNRSPFSVNYFTPREFAALLERNGFAVDLFAAFPDNSRTAVSRAISIVRKAAVSLRLIPETMKGKEWLKRLFYGKLMPIPAELADGMVSPAPLDRIETSTRTAIYRFYYAVGTLSGGKQ